MYTCPSSISSFMCRKKSVSSSVRMCEPSTSASHMRMILPYRRLSDVEFLADARADGREDVPDLLVLQDLVQARLLDVQDLPLQREDGLEAPVPSLLRAAAGRITLDEVQLAVLRIVDRAVGQLARQSRRSSARSSAASGRAPSAPPRAPRPRACDLSMMRAWRRRGSRPARSRAPGRSPPRRCSSPRCCPAWSWSAPRTAAPAPSRSGPR